MQIKEIPIDKLKPYNKNPRRNDKAVDAFHSVFYVVAIKNRTFEKNSGGGGNNGTSEKGY